MPRLLVIIASTRPGRLGLPVARWFVPRAEVHAAFEVDVVDLAEQGLPFLDEPHHPRLGRYVHDHTRRWSSTVSAADAFVLVIPEYNHGLSAPLKNAIDFLHAEWGHKPVGFVSYGGVSGGMRAVEMSKPVLAALRMTAAVAAVTIPFVAKRIDELGELRSDDALDAAAEAMLDELAWLETALRPLRARHGPINQTRLPTRS